MSRRAHSARLALRWIGPALLLWLVLRLDDPLALVRAIHDADWGWLGAAVLLNVPVVVLKVVRWRGLLAERGFRYPLGRAHAAVLSSLYLGSLTPGRVGDAVRIQYVRCEIGTPYVEGLATTIMDRLCDLYVLGVVASLGVVHFAAVLRDDLAATIWLAVAIALGLPLLVLVRGPTEVFGWALRRFASRWHASLERLVAAVRALLPKALLVALPLTAAAFATSYAQGWMIARAIGVELSYIDVAALLSATSLLGLAPISVSGIGVRELFLALVFPALALRPEQGVLYGLLVFACIYLATALMGFIAWQLSPPPVEAASESA